MRRLLIFALLVSGSAWLAADQRAATDSMLTIDSIMRGPDLIGSAPSSVRWSSDSSELYFSWRTPDEDEASTYAVDRNGAGLRRLTPAEIGTRDLPRTGAFDSARERVLVTENGDVALYDVASGERRLLTRTTANESNARWAGDDRAVTFVREGNLFLMALEGAGPLVVQLTDVVSGDQSGRAGGPGGGAGGRRGRGGRGASAATTDSQLFLEAQERDLIEYIRQLAERRQGGGGRGGRGGRGRRGGSPPAPPAEPIARFTLGPRQSVNSLQLSGDGHHVWLGVTERPEETARGQGTPNYVTESSYPEMISGRPNVGDVQTRRLLAALSLDTRETAWADGSTFAGVEGKADAGDPDESRRLNWGMPDQSDDGAHHVISVRSQDNKDRWFVTVDAATGETTVLDRLYDEAWIRLASVGGGGGGGAGIRWLSDNRRFLFLSEASGWMHLYSLDVTAEAPAAVSLTSGPWEVTAASLSRDRQTVFLTTSEAHPGERHFYTLPVNGGAPTRLTGETGSHAVTVSPDESRLAVVHSYSTKPPELYVMPFETGATPTEVTTTPSEEWRSFPWIDPQIITYEARDGETVHARLYTPEMIGAERDPTRPAVVFVHGAGYLQNAHKYWSNYYREYMFHNLLASRGYVVLDADYRASAGYGRDWRTAIYRHMGGHDLNDVVDGARFLVETEGVDPDRIGVYGGSYGGFITLMAMFTTPDVFAAGAALRPVTDWSHYNHGYTSNILNVPQLDPEAYERSSPIYFAEGLTGRLLIAHGMVDTNVFFQDSVRLAQRLIELRKENWEIAPYPVESHGFTEETSWADEYKRILKLFEETLRDQ